MKTKILSAVALVGALAAQSAAALNLPSDAAWARGDAGTLYAEWDFFSNVTNAAPDVGSANVSLASLSETSGGSIVTGGGNIYSFMIPSAFEIGISGDGNGPASGSMVEVYLQIESQGTALDLGSVVLNGQSGSGGLVSSVPLGGFGGNLDTYLFSWTLSAVDDWLFSFSAPEPHLSLDRVAVDFGSVAEVPLPAAAWLFVSGVAGLGVARRRQLAQA